MMHTHSCARPCCAPRRRDLQDTLLVILLPDSLDRMPFFKNLFFATFQQLSRGPQRPSRAFGSAGLSQIPPNDARSGPRGLTEMRQVLRKPHLQDDNQIHQMDSPTYRVSCPASIDPARHTMPSSHGAHTIHRVGVPFKKLWTPSGRQGHVP